MGDRRVAAGAIFGLAVAATPAAARIYEYQVARLLSYKTQCEMAKLEDRSPATGPMRFFASCDNTTFYPDGIEITCPDRDDDRSCTLLTKEKSFDQLQLLKKKP